MFILLLQGGFAVAVNTGIVAFEDDTTFATKTRRFQEQLDQARDPYVALAFGSSRILNGFDAERVMRPLREATGRETIVFNFGVSGCGPIYSVLALEQLVAAGVRPDFVLIEVYPMFLVSNAEQIWFQASELRSRNFENTERYGITPVAHAWHRRWLTPLHTHRFHLLSQFSPKLLPIQLRDNWAREADRFGWIPVDAPMSPQRFEQQVHSFATELGKIELQDPPCRALRDAVQLCRRLDIDCVLVWMPECREIREHYPPRMESLVGGYLARLQREFSVPVVNARAWVDNPGFYDSWHLNRGGAIQFTEALCREGLPPQPRAAVAELDHPVSRER